MANEVYIDGSTVLISIKSAADTAFAVVGCSTNNGDTISRNPIKILNKCNYPWGEAIAGEGAWSITQTADAIIIDESATPAPSTHSYQKLRMLSISGEVFDIKMANADGTFYLGGKAMISAFSETGDIGKQLSYQVTFEGQQEPVIVNPAP